MPSWEFLRTEWNTQADTAAKKALALFVLDSVDQFFIDSKSKWISPKTGKSQALANREATVRKKKKISNLDLARGSGRVASDLLS